MTSIIIRLNTDHAGMQCEVDDPEATDGNGNALTEPDGYAIGDVLFKVAHGFRGSVEGMNGYKIQDPAYGTGSGIGAVAVTSSPGALLAFFHARRHRELSAATQQFIDRVRAGIPSNAIGDPFSFGEIRDMIALAAADMAGIDADIPQAAGKAEDDDDDDAAKAGTE